MSEKLIVMAFTRLREAGKVSNIQWCDIVAHDPTGRLASLRGVARKEALDSATRRCGVARRRRAPGDVYDFLDAGKQFRRRGGKS